MEQNLKKINWIIRKVAPGMVEIKSSAMENIPTLEEYKTKILEILKERYK